jgi:uncharacterized protein YutD
MLACANTSFVVSVEQISYMVIANNNTYMVNQNMKSYFVDFFSSKIHVICDYGWTQLVQHD